MKPLTAEERRTQTVGWLKIIRLRVAIGRELDDRGVKTPLEVGEALGLEAAEAQVLLTSKQWRDSDLERLRILAKRLGVAVSEEESWW
ncbi:hypothetical protein JMJ56_30640 [Belnapia sp. T18]|uniref:XRE family transcriptional regulator n=1 Tax=Belnapia arida TaxID=2804533 RepID=A0ABS1UCU3_9PROT|nr:hypothetical protein [Belnapia arida]MBL6082335.1 hypothetical protein [Belnapia arida]